MTWLVLTEITGLFAISLHVSFPRCAWAVTIRFVLVAVVWAVFTWPTTYKLGQNVSNAV